MKLGIDLCMYTSVHNGGKVQATYNLLEGLIALNHGQDIVCICYEEFEPTLKKIFPAIKARSLSDKLSKGKNKYFDRGKAIKTIIAEEGLDIIYFSDKFSPMMSLTIPSVLIAHDVQVFIPELAEIAYKRKIDELKTKMLIYADFYFRTKVFAISQDDKSNMIRYIPFSKKKIQVVKDPIKFLGNPNPHETDNYITAINIQWVHKNVFTLIKAFCSISQSIEYDLVCVGKKPDNIEEIEYYINGTGLADRIHFTGFVSEEELQRIIGQTRVYVNPSLYEGFGMTAVEMMGNGIPTIVADNSAQRETTLGLCRYYSPATDNDALAKSIMEEIETPTSKEKLKMISDKIRSTYNHVRVAQEIWGYLEDTCR